MNTNDNCQTKLTTRNTHIQVRVKKDKKVQIGHSFDINFKLKLVNDSIKYNDDKKKSKGYNLIEGKHTLNTDLVDVSTSRSRKYLKKKITKNV